MQTARIATMQASFIAMLNANPPRLKLFIHTVLFMPSIRLYHCQVVDNIISAPKAFLQCPSAYYHIPGLLKCGSLLYFPFGGFVEKGKLESPKYVKLVGFSSYSSSDDALGPWIDFEYGTCLLGVFWDKKYFLVLKDNQVICV